VTWADLLEAGLAPTAGRVLGALFARCDWASIRTRPHGLRHASITAALDATDGDVRKVIRHSRHVRLETFQLYDDRRHDDTNDVVTLVAEE
jgi:integrase